MKKSTSPVDSSTILMLVEIDYRKKLIFPIEAGKEFISNYARARVMEEEYQKPPKIFDTPPPLQVSFITEGEIAKMKLKNAVLPEDQENT